MGKPTGKKKVHDVQKPGTKQGKAVDRNSKALDEDTAIFINMSQELREEGNKLFQKRDSEGAMLKYEKALKLLPRNHIDVAHLHSNMAACYMQLGLGEYPRAINECNLALEVSPRYSKALLRRSRCYEALNRLDLALRDVNTVLSMEPNNLNALEILESVKKVISEKGIVVDEKEIGIVDVQQIPAARFHKVVKEKTKKKKGKMVEEKTEDKAVVEENVRVIRDKEVVTKTVEEEKPVLKHIEEEKQVVNRVEEKHIKEETVVRKTVKLVFGEDIRWAQLPVNCSMWLVREIVKDRFPGLKGVLVKYKDQEGDLVTITTTDELRLAESSCDTRGSLRFFITEVGADQEPIYEGSSEEEARKEDLKPSNVVENGDSGNHTEVGKGSTTCVEDWIIQFARLFKNHVGFDSDSYLDLHELGVKLYSEAMEDTVTLDDAQELFDIAAIKFQEMAALALFNWGNVHMSKARKRASLPEDASRETITEQIKAAYEWAQKEYKKAESRYEEAVKVKPDFYEGYLALGQQQFEQAKLSWYYAIGSKIELQTEPSSEVLQLYNKAEDSMDKGMLLWEEIEERRLNGLSKEDKYKAQLQKMGLDGLFEEMSADEAAEQAANMKSQIYLLWGTLLYERSVVEYKLELPTWEECLEVAIEKFELCGASPTDIAVMIKNHCSPVTMSVASSQQSFLANALIPQTHKPKTKFFTSPNTISCKRISSSDDDHQKGLSRKNENQFAKLAMVTLAAGVLTLGTVDDASAAKSGGRVGGQAFRSSVPRSSSPRINNNSRTNIYINPPVAPPLVGGYGYGYGSPFFGGWGWSPFSFFTPGPSVAIGIGGGFQLLAIAVFLGAIAAVARRFNASRDEEDDDYY